MTRKILYSPGYGVGWSSWQSVPRRFACEYEPIIKALERGENLCGDVDDIYRDGEDITKYHPAVQQYVKDCKEKFGQDYVCLGGLRDLEIYELSEYDDYKIKCFDGSESVKIIYD